MEIKSDFKDGGVIPEDHTCDGIGISPPIEISEVPKETVSFVLTMEDPDMPLEVQESLDRDIFDHWILFNISPETRIIKRGDSSVGTLGVNSSKESAYTGPCPPSDKEPKEHRYFFKLYSLDTEIYLDEGSSKEEIEGAMEGHVIDIAELIGIYSRDEDSE